MSNQKAYSEKWKEKNPENFQNQIDELKKENEKLWDVVCLIRDHLVI